MSVLLRDVELAGQHTDVLVVGDRVVAVGPDLAATTAEVVDGRGGALLPGLHDHHLHLLALAATLASVDLTGVSNLGTLGAALRHGVGLDGWVRAVGHHERAAGHLDRHVLDRLVRDVPVRVQHRGGAVWILNSEALRRVAHVLDGSADVERAADGSLTGRLWRYDGRLRPALPQRPPDLGAVSRVLTSYGITSVTDATPDLDQVAVALLRTASRDGSLPQQVTLLGDPDGNAPRKLLLRDHDLPSYDELRRLVCAAHAAGRAVAVHCVTRESLLLTLAVLDDVGTLAGDRIEHASVVPPEVRHTLHRLGLAVVTQPTFVTDRGDDYLREVSRHDMTHLYPFASLVADDIAVTSSSDAPFGHLDPWRAMRAAVGRTTRAGVVLGPDERVTPHVALDGYLSSPLAPGGPTRGIVPGSIADLCLLDVPLAEALRDLDRAHVAQVLIGGRRQLVVPAQA